MRDAAALLATRRHFLETCGLGLGGIALASLMPRVASGAAPSQRPRHRARAKNVVYLHMSGAPPQQDLFDPKPRLKQLDGQPCPDEFLKGRRLAFTKGHPTLLGSPHGFARAGSAGMEVSALMPHFRRIADEVTLVRSMHTDQFNHAPAELLLFTGSPVFGGASMGSWVAWGLGSENADLPAYVVMVSGDSDPSGGKSLWSSGFLPSSYQGVQLRAAGDPILFVADPKGLDRATRRRSLDALKRLNELDPAADAETRSRIEQYELAFRMQTAVPDVMDIGRESAETLARYGAVPGQASYASNCLLARRLVESGVRFVQLFDWGWDVHGTGPGDDLITRFPQKCRDVDRATTALVLDLKARGLLDETLVVFGGEFGRTPTNERRDGSTFLGRDHHPDCFSIWLAGAGVKRGAIVGATDELGYRIVEDPISVRDLQATILHLLGMDPFQLRFPYQGLEQRLIGPTDEARVRRELFA